MRTVASILLLMLTFISYGQDLKAIKKSITDKGVKTVEVLPLEDANIYYYTTNKGDGIWDDDRKQVILRNAKFSGKSPDHPKWFLYTKNGSYGIFDRLTNNILMESVRTIKVHTTPMEQIKLLFAGETVGLYDSVSGKSLFINWAALPKENLETQLNDDATLSFNSEQSSLMYFAETEVFGDPTFVSFSLTRLGNNFRGFYSGFSNRSYMYNKLGDFLRDVSGEVQRWDKGFIVQGYSTISYYNYAMKTLFDRVPIDQHNLEHFQTLFDDRISEVKSVTDGRYLVKIDGLQGFYNVVTRKFDSEVFKDIIKIGTNIYWGGTSWYTQGEAGYGLYNSLHGELLRPKYEIIEFRALSDGNYGYRADNELRVFNIVKKALKRQPLQLWHDTLSLRSIIIHHLSVKGNQLILSLRRTSADTHDYRYGTMTYYETGSGVYDISAEKWLIQPTYHTFTPYGDYFVALSPGNSNYTWTETAFFDEELWPISAQPMGVSFIYKGQVITRTDDWHLVAMDIYNNYILKDLGKVDYVPEDFRLVDDYLFLGHNEYLRDKSLRWFDIGMVITPDLQLLKSDEYVFRDYLGTDFMLIGMVPKDFKKESVTDFYRRKFTPEKYAILDLRTNLIATDWYDKISVENSAATLSIGDETKTISLKELR